MNPLYFYFTLFVILTTGSLEHNTTSQMTNDGSGEMQERKKAPEVLLTTLPSGTEALVTTEKQQHRKIDAETTPSMNTDNVTTSASSLPNEPYDCSATNMSQRASAIASFQKGLSLIVDELNHRILQVSKNDEIPRIMCICSHFT